MNKKLIVFLLIPVWLLTGGCAAVSCSKGTGNQDEHGAAHPVLRIVSWNTETFFDAVKDGTEYSAFTASKTHWNRDAYVGRLDRLCKLIITLDADVYVFEEIENDGVLYDVSNRLAGNAWNGRRCWKYACFAKKKGGAIGCAVLSRFPLSGLTVHALDVRTAGTEPAMRPVMKVSVLAGNKPLVLFVNHWKSKSEGKEETEIWRNWQESVLAGLIAATDGAPAAACGDFNRDISEFSRDPGTGSVILRYAGPVQTEDVPVVSPWPAENGTAGKTGSYYFNNTWERIDHIFTAGSASASDFAAESSGPWADSGGIPIAYKVYTGTGWSDHLPVAATVTY